MKIQKHILNRFLKKYDLKKMILNEASFMGGSSMTDDGPVFLHKNIYSYSKKSKELAELIGYTILDGELSNIDFSKNQESDYPKGPIDVTAYLNDETNEKWRKHINRVARQIGFKFIDFNNKYN